MSRKQRQNHLRVAFRQVVKEMDVLPLDTNGQYNLELRDQLVLERLELMQQNSQAGSRRPKEQYF